MNAKQVEKELQKYASQKKATQNQKFFKTGKGEYGEGDVFIGVTVPEQRKVAQLFVDASFDQIETLLKSDIHEHRLTGLFILVYKFKKADKKEQKKIFAFYTKHIEAVNNWDLVDTTAPDIIGVYLDGLDKKLLYTYARAEHLWKNRIAIVATWTYIKKRNFTDTIAIADMLLQHEHDLIHKAVGWMLREVGKRDEKVLRQFLQQHYKTMPRTMLRYAIEKFSKRERDKYLKGLV